MWVSLHNSHLKLRLSYLFPVWLWEKTNSLQTFLVVGLGVGRGSCDTVLALGESTGGCLRYLLLFWYGIVMFSFSVRLGVGWLRPRPEFVTFWWRLTGKIHDLRSLVHCCVEMPGIATMKDSVLSLCSVCLNNPLCQLQHLPHSVTREMVQLLLLRLSRSAHPELRWKGQCLSITLTFPSGASTETWEKCSDCSNTSSSLMSLRGNKRNLLWQSYCWHDTGWVLPTHVWHLALV